MQPNDLLDGVEWNGVLAQSDVESDHESTLVVVMCVWNINT